MEKFNSAKWIKDYKSALIEEKDKKEKAVKADDNIKKSGKAIHAKDLLHTTKVDGKKADKVDMKIGAENDLPIEKDKDGNDVGQMILIISEWLSLEWNFRFQKT